MQGHMNNVIIMPDNDCLQPKHVVFLAFFTINIYVVYGRIQLNKHNWANMLQLNMGFVSKHSNCPNTKVLL
jgi:hypothetical protein